MKHARARRTVAEKHDADSPVPTDLRGPRRTRGKRQIPPHHSGRAEHAARRIHQVHRPAATTAQAGVAPDDLGEGGLGIATLGKGVAVSSMPGEERVLVGQVGTDPDRHGLLARGKMGKSRHFSSSGQPLHLPLEKPDAAQAAQHRFPVIEGRNGRRHCAIGPGLRSRKVRWIQYLNPCRPGTLAY